MIEFENAKELLKHSKKSKITGNVKALGEKIKKNLRKHTGFFKLWGFIAAEIVIMVTMLVLIVWAVGKFPIIGVILALAGVSFFLTLLFYD